MIVDAMHCSYAACVANIHLSTDLNAIRRCNLTYQHFGSNAIALTPEDFEKYVFPLNNGYGYIFDWPESESKHCQDLNYHAPMLLARKDKPSFTFNTLKDLKDEDIEQSFYDRGLTESRMLCPVDMG